jgi:hypothetical protein
MYATKEEARAAFTKLLYDKDVVSNWPWDKVRLPAYRLLRRRGPQQQKKVSENNGRQLSHAPS